MFFSSDCSEVQRALTFLPSRDKNKNLLVFLIQCLTASLHFYCKSRLSDEFVVSRSALSRSETRVNS